MLCDRQSRCRSRPAGRSATDVDPCVTRVVDVKTPAPARPTVTCTTSFATLRASDQVKFVIADRADYDWSRERASRRWPRPALHGAVLAGGLAACARLLADWIVDDNPPVRFQLQLHKVLWGDQPGK